MPFFAKIFYDPRACKAAAGWGVLRTTAHFALLCAITGASIFATIYQPVKKAYSQNIGALAGALENVKIKDGKIAPYSGKNIEVKNAEGGVFAIISEKSIDANTAKKLAFSIESQRLSIYSPEGEISFDLGGMDFGAAENLAQTLPSWDTLAAVAVPAVSLAMAVSIMAWRAFMLGAFAFIIDIPHRRLRLANSLKLAVAASTPAAAIGLAYSLAAGRVLPEAASMAISALVLYLAASAIIRGGRD